MKYPVSFDIDFKRNPYMGLYIALEGIDGSGKTTQVDRVYDHFVSQGRAVVKTREPRKDEGVVGQLIQKILQGKTAIPSVAFQYLFSAERAIHHAELIEPALQRGDIVISDRCFWSAVPYGIMDRDGNVTDQMGDWLLVSQSILSLYHQFIAPDITIYLDVPLSLAMKRLGAEKKKKEIYETKEQLAKTITGYNWLLQKFPKEFTVIDATNNVEAVTTEIISTL
jgi:dTMP kinase